MLATPQPRFMGVITGLTLSALLLVVRPAASLLVATAEGRTGRYWTGLLVLVAVGWTLGTAVLAGRQSPPVVGIPAVVLVVVYGPLLANEFVTPRWYPGWMEWTHSVIDLPLLVGLLLGVAVRVWRTRRRTTT